MELLINRQRMLLMFKMKVIFTIEINKSSNSNIISDEPDGMADEEDIPILDNWAERAADDI
jgi:hypothetical protein